VVQQFDGRLPDDPAVLQADVPGIGRYSAGQRCACLLCDVLTTPPSHTGAICSIAYGKCVPVLDGNVHRLLSRVLALHASPKAKATTDLLWSGAEAIVKGSKDPGAVNQGLIELGSTICTPTDPKCGGCPIRTNCGAFKMQSVRFGILEAREPSLILIKGKVPVIDIEDQCDICEPLPSNKPTVTIFPMKVEKKIVPKETDLICVISWKRRGDPTTYYLLRKRPKRGKGGYLNEGIN
jgi:A/G-specific adenine glycosylase